MHHLNAIKLIAVYARFYWGFSLFCLWMTGCSSLQPPAPKTVYDFGLPVAAQAPSAANGAAIALADVQAAASIDGVPLLYRLAYADAQVLRAYAQARWSAPPAQLLEQRLRTALATRGPVLGAATAATSTVVLKLELDEFSQVFDAPAQSAALVRVRATLMQADKLLAQQSFAARQATPSADAAGGARALLLASDDVIAQMLQWLDTRLRP
jgi:cholesterol transport system auxiliary component